MRLVAAADWQDVMVAALTLAGVIVNALVILWCARQVRTPSHRRLGELVEETHTITAGRVVDQLERIRKNGETRDDNDQDAE